MHRSLALATAVALLMAVSLSATALAGGDRPISGRFTVGIVPVEQRCGPNALTIGFEGTGIATHLGRMSGHGSNCTEFSFATSSVEIWDGVATFVAADGSTITVHYEGVQTAPDAGAAATIVTNTVVSGTGRFDDAEGSWTQSGEIDFTTGLFSGAFSGWIRY
jgi:hypothetical protein